VVNDNHGRFALRSAATLPPGPIYADRANRYDICEVREDVLLTDGTGRRAAGRLAVQQPDPGHYPRRSDRSGSL
jgi:hypothetical protein